MVLVDSSMSIDVFGIWYLGWCTLYFTHRIFEILDGVFGGREGLCSIWDSVTNLVFWMPNLKFGISEERWCDGLMSIQTIMNNRPRVEDQIMMTSNRGACIYG